MNQLISTEIRPYGNTEKRLERELERLRLCFETESPDSNYRIIHKYIYRRKVLGTSVVQLLKDCNAFFVLHEANSNKPFMAYEEEDILRVIETLNNKRYNNKKLSSQTKRLRFSCIRHFFRSLGKIGIFSSIDIRFKQTSDLGIEDVLNEQERERICSAAAHFSYQKRAMLAVLLETNVRSSEFYSMRRRFVTDEGNIIRIRVFGKDHDRYVSIIDKRNQEAFRKWFYGAHPSKYPDSLIWITKRMKPVHYVHMRRFFQEIKDATGIQKRLSIYSFRRTLATEAVMYSMPTPVFEKTFGTTAIKNYTQPYLSFRDSETAKRSIMARKNAQKEIIELTERLIHLKKELARLESQ